MILDKKLNVKIAKYNIEHYRNLFNVNLGDIIEIITESQLQKQSNVKINVSCDICNIQRYIKAQAYFLNTKRSVDLKTYCCDKCSHIKIKQTNLKKYGVEYYSQSSEFSSRIKKTSMDKFGVEHYSKTQDYIDSRSKTNLEKYGIDNPFRDTTKIKKSLFDKYGVENPSQLLEFSEKAKISTRITKESKNYWIPLSEKSDWNLYKREVRYLTRKNIKLINWNGFDFYDNEYIKDNFNLNCYMDKYPTIDHKISIYEGFIKKIPAEDIAGIENLCWTKRSTNRSKSNKFI